MATHEETTDENWRKKLVETLLIIGLILVALILLLLLKRFIAYYRIRKIKDLTQYPAAFRKKYYYFKEREAQKTTTSFMMIAVLLCALIGVVFLGMFSMSKQVDGIQRKEYWTQAVVQAIYKEEKQATDQKKLKGYPKRDIGLSKNDVKSLEQQSTEQRKRTLSELEETLTNRLSPYLGQGTVSLSWNPTSKALEIIFTGEVDGNAETLSVLSQNISSFITETEEVSNVTEVYLQIREKGKHQMVYQATFVRNAATGQFELQKNARKGKG